MASYQTFTSPRTTVPDPLGLLPALKTALADATASYSQDFDRSFRVKKAQPFSAGDLTAAQAAIDTTPARTPLQQATLTSRDKDILATIALVVRARNITAWTALTTPQKVTAVLAEADVWATIRDFLETNAP